MKTNIVNVNITIKLNYEPDLMVKSVKKLQKFES